MGELLQIDPPELRFPFELKKQISYSLPLSNATDDHIAFKVKTTSPKKYSVRPTTGIVSPHSTADVVVTMQAQYEAPPDMQCKDKFLVQSVVVPAGSTAADITADMFTKESGKKVDEIKLRVVFVPPPKRPAPIQEEPEEGSPPPLYESADGSSSTVETVGVPRLRREPQERPEAALIAKLTDEKNASLQLNQRLKQELELLRRSSSKGRGGFSIIFVMAVALVGIVLGYLIKS